MLIKEKEFDALEKAVNKLDIPKDYIPTEDDLETMGKDPDKYAAFLVWLCGNHPEPENEKEKGCLKQAVRLRNKSIEFVEEDN